MSQYQEKATVIRAEQFSDKNYRLTLDSPDIAGTAKAGQFVMIRAGFGKDPLLRRPFSIHQTSADGRIQIFLKLWVGVPTCLPVSELERYCLFLGH